MWVIKILCPTFLLFLQQINMRSSDMSFQCPLGQWLTLTTVKTKIHKEEITNSFFMTTEISRVDPWTSFFPLLFGF